MDTMYKYIFGPVLSRRFGLSLGIDLSPEKKSCNFDCLYCELEKARPIDKIENQPDPDDIVKEVHDYLSKNHYPDVITTTANGEPTLYTRLNELIDKLNKIKGSSKTLILSNGSTINNPTVREALKKFDIVKLSLDAADQKTFEKIDRPLKGIKIDDIIKGMISFRKEYKGSLVLEVLVVKHINDKKEVIEKIVEAAKKINPDRIDISTVDRPPAYRVFPVDNQTLYEIAKMFEGLNVNVATRKSGGSVQKVHLDKEDIIKTFKNRAYTESDIETLFDDETKKNILDLLSQNQLKFYTVANLKFIKA
ncbi:MoaA/NifB/PqqE family protein [Sulfurihydrogenibium azorense Az-Fu1]|uniref:MoaA/NifB/PqqE family protein n=2 Tax=Sulfurihydrogenibium azorense TaxID=309806 RepID=C1DU67_SULAA|nr:MoaA/NifB/PqqE family protein [Sulfurihydrogenibium azorense Az-Fu1]